MRLNREKKALKAFKDFKSIFLKLQIEVFIQINATIVRYQTLVHSINEFDSEASIKKFQQNPNLPKTSYGNLILPALFRNKILKCLLIFS